MRLMASGDGTRIRWFQRGLVWASLSDDTTHDTRTEALCQLTATADLAISETRCDSCLPMLTYVSCVLIMPALRKVVKPGLAAPHIQYTSLAATAYPPPVAGS